MITILTDSQTGHPGMIPPLVSGDVQCGNSGNRLVQAEPVT
jgi:hypothetical protein